MQWEQVRANMYFNGFNNSGIRNEQKIVATIRIMQSWWWPLMKEVERWMKEMLRRCALCWEKMRSVDTQT